MRKNLAGVLGFWGYCKTDFGQNGHFHHLSRNFDFFQKSSKTFAEASRSRERPVYGLERLVRSIPSLRTSKSATITTKRRI